MSDTADTIDITVLIVAYKSVGTLTACLAALQAQTRAPREVLVLENGSPEGQRVGPADMPSGVRLIESEKNLGFAGGNNLLAKAAGSTWLALLNPDAYARPDWIEQFEAARRKYPEIALFGSTQFAAGKTDVLDGTGDCYHALGLAYRSGYGRRAGPLAEGEVFAACGAAMFIRRDVFEALGGFDERFFCYNEDVDLGYRARLNGLPTVQLAAAIVDHVGYGSSGRRSEIATYYGVRNRLWVFLKNTPGWLFWLLLPGHVAVTFALWLSSFRFGQGALFARAIRDAVSGRADILASRREIQANRRVSPMRVARMMNWNPADLFTRRAKVRPIDDQGA
ncbi:glycosyltransferase family 2 protein [Maricaulis maris]|uniref:GT2 family glycosyltransferase n=1 Tax=Maricaulis maris TaxID=74318 RepID=A0A495CXX6_9PROT|nr:glycosyltransferase family 2 protein [Maricaulis maris]RKQ94152.1 GT2 family glycosyltransferase [Maricaulis maris]